MKKLLLLCFTPFLFSACSTMAPQTVDKDFLVGEWSCSTTYDEIGVGSIDLITLNADGTTIDENFLFDHGIEKFVNKPIQNWFSSPLQYLRTNSGNWQLKGNRLTYNFKTSTVKRLIKDEFFQTIQNIKPVKEYEEGVFKIYSANHNEPIELEIINHSNDGDQKQFTVIQSMGDKTYQSSCVDINSAPPLAGKQRLNDIKGTLK